MTDIQSRELTLHGSGLLTYTKWVYDEDKGEGEFVVTPIKDNKHTMFKLLDKKIHFEPDVTFGSLLCMLHDNPLADPSMYDLLWNNACVKEAIDYFIMHNHEFIPHAVSEPDAIEYLEVYRLWTCDSKTGIVEYPIATPSFHGKGFVQSDGYTTNYCMSYSDPKTMYDMPVRLRTNGEIIEGNYDLWESAYYANGKKEVPPLFVFNADFTLREVIQSIFWEMSWSDSYHAKLRGQTCELTGWPSLSDIADAVIKEELESDDIKNIKYLHREDMIKYHHSLGRFIRNEYWLNNPKCPHTKTWFDDRAAQKDNYLVDGVDEHPNHPDQVSMEVLHLIWDKVNK